LSLYSFPSGSPEVQSERKRARLVFYSSSPEKDDRRANPINSQPINSTPGVNRRASTELNDSTGDFQLVKPTTRRRASTGSNDSMDERTLNLQLGNDSDVCMNDSRQTANRRMSNVSDISMDNSRQTANRRMSNVSDISMDNSRQTANRRMSNVSDISMGPVNSKDQPSQHESTANSSRNSLPIASYSDESPSQMLKKAEMRNALRDKLRVKTAAQPMSTEGIRNKKSLQKFKIRLLGAGPSADAHQLSPLTQQPGTLSQQPGTLFFRTYFLNAYPSFVQGTSNARGLSPPPRSAPSKNPFKNGTNKRKALWK